MMRNNIDLSPPRRLLLATDFSVDDDRALERAKQLARDWRADLTLVSPPNGLDDPAEVLDWFDRKEGADAGMRMFRRARSAFLGSNLDVRMHVAAGDTPGVVRRAAAALDSDLVIASAGSRRSVRDFLLGTTAERLLRTLSRPLLVVRNRAHAAYRRIVVATDFSAGSRQVLESAARLFPEHVLVLYHVHRRPYARLVNDRGALHGAGIEAAHGACARFVAECTLSGAVRRGLRIVIEEVPLATGLARFVRNHDIDLVIAGARARTAITRVLSQGAAESLVYWLSCDTLVIPGRRERMKRGRVVA
ncbi:MAG TPA: universal stress protein [Noviherbaspirillum sp.]|uniref:universal stress protein n=1 Tax=Noviherbaspirillum sp. TaxID=1926288 RepID=UPI002F9286AB